MAELELKHETDFTWIDISAEMFRMYEFHDGYTVALYRPQWLSVSERGGHRILTVDEVSHYIPPGWVHLRWKVFPDKSHFVA